jgi:hypothetical protein
MFAPAYVADKAHQRLVFVLDFLGLKKPGHVVSKAQARA